MTETPTASPTWIETLVATITGETLTPSPTIKPDDALATPTLGPTATFPVMPGIELTPALAFPSPEALALDLEPEQPLPVLESTDFRDPHDVDWEFTEPVMEPTEDGTYWLHFRTPYAVRARLPEQNNVTLTLNLRMTGGRVSIRTHYTEGIGYYRFSLSADGLLELARGETVVASVRLVPVQPEHWRSLRLAVTGRSLRASIDGAMVLHYVDRAPLPPGQVWLAADGIPSGDIWIDNVQMTGSTPRAEIALPIVEPPLDMMTAGMNLSPFSTQEVVVFDRLMDPTNGNHDLFRMNIAGGDYAALPNATGSKEYEPALSRDGSHIAFTAWRDGNSGSANTNIWVMKTDGTLLTQITNNSADEYSPTWSNDNTHIAFVSNRGGVERVYVMNISSSEPQTQPTLITTGKDPAWSPDGTALAISAVNTATDNTYDLYIVDMTNTNYTRYHLLGQSLRAELQPSWSSDNSAIAFTSIIYNGTTPEYTLRRVLRYPPYTVNEITALKNAVTADYSPTGGELLWRLTYQPPGGTPSAGFSRAPSTLPTNPTHYPVHKSNANTFNPDWGIFVPPPPPSAVPPPTSSQFFLGQQTLPAYFDHPNGMYHLNGTFNSVRDHSDTLVGFFYEVMTTGGPERQVVVRPDGSGGYSPPPDLPAYQPKTYCVVQIGTYGGVSYDNPVSLCNAITAATGVAQDNRIAQGFATTVATPVGGTFLHHFGFGWHNNGGVTFRVRPVYFRAAATATPVPPTATPVPSTATVRYKDDLLPGPDAGTEGCPPGEAGRLECAEQVYDQFYVAFQEANSNAAPRFRNLIAALHPEEITSSFDTNASRAALGNNYVNSCGLGCNRSELIAWLASKQGWYVLGRSSGTAAVSRLVTSSTSTVYLAIADAVFAPNVAWPGACTTNNTIPCDWGNWGLQDPQYADIRSRNDAVVSCTIVQYWRDGNPHVNPVIPADGEVSYPPDYWTDYLFAVVTRDQDENLTSTSTYSFPNPMPTWLNDPIQRQIRTPNFYFGTPCPDPLS